MANWRDHVASTTETEIDQLVRAAVDQIQGSLAASGAVRPCMIALSVDGDTELCEDDATNRRNVLATRVQMQPSQFRTVAFMVDERDQNEVQIAVEHADGVAITVIGPYGVDRRTGQVVFQPFHSEMAEPILWKTHAVAV
jgi:hypothetical protein